jgi:hypothetical protein
MNCRLLNLARASLSLATNSSNSPGSLSWAMYTTNRPFDYSKNLAILRKTGDHSRWYGAYHERWHWNTLLPESGFISEGTPNRDLGRFRTGDTTQCGQGEVYANVWQTDRIARIDSATGRVFGWIDLTGLLSVQDRQTPVDVLNGIAYDAEHNRLFMTGKLWPKLFEIKLISTR